MSEPSIPALIDVGKLSKPATVMVNRLSDFIGGAFKPLQMRRIAKSQVEVAKIKAVGRVQVSEIEERGLIRLVREEGRNQKNIEDIVQKSLPKVSEASRPEELEPDWLGHFFDLCKHAGDVDMQKIWASLLAGEANSPGTFSNAR